MSVDKATVSLGFAFTAFLAVGGVLVWIGGKAEALDSHLDRDYPKMEKRIERLEDKIEETRDSARRSETILEGIAGTLGVAVPKQDGKAQHNGGR